MSNYCEDCDRLKEKPEGNAPPRMIYNQPTMYDHFSDFRKYKQAKDEEQQRRARREELLKFNENFTNLHLTSSDRDDKDVLDQFSTRDIVKYRKELRMGQMIEKEDYTGVGAPSTDDSGTQLKKTPSLLTISRTPVQCPVNKCGRTIGVTSVLSHYLRDHNEDLGVQCQEIFGGRRSILIFDPNLIEFRENICLGVLAYGGINEDSIHRPSARGICMQNAFLSKTHDHLEGHLPILIIACKTSWSAMLPDKELEKQLTDPADEQRHLLIVWLVSVQTTKPIYCTITAFDKAMISSRSTITQIRHLNDPQNPSEFLSTDTNYLRLSRGEIDILSHKGSECVRIEIMINEFQE